MSNSAVVTESALHRLENVGDPRKTWKWRDRTSNYVADLHLGSDDIPELIEIARSWVTQTEWPDDEDDMSVYAPIHAWRALAQLGATEAIDLLLDMLPIMDERMDDWHLEEFPYAFALIGPSVVEPVASFLEDSNNAEFARICAAHSLCEIAQRHPETSGQPIHRLANRLERYEENEGTLNAFLIGYLVDLKARDHAELIERAYAAGCVDATVVGRWSTIRKELGVPGLGLVPTDSDEESISTVQPSGSTSSDRFNGTRRQRRKRRVRARKGRRR